MKVFFCLISNLVFLRINYLYHRLDIGHRGSKKDSPIKNTDELSLVDRIIELSDLKQGFVEVCEYLEMENKPVTLP